MDLNSENLKKNYEKKIPNILRRKPQCVDSINPTSINRVLKSNDDPLSRVSKINDPRLLAQNISNVHPNVVTVSTVKEVESSNMLSKKKGYQTFFAKNLFRMIE